jgi:RND family efflux transporter MFP subunit
MRFRALVTILGLAFFLYSAQAGISTLFKQDSAALAHSNQLPNDKAGRIVVAQSKQDASRSPIGGTNSSRDNDSSSTELNLKLGDTIKQIQTSEGPSGILQENKINKIEATVINPYRVAAVAAEVGGLIDNFYFEPGDFVHEGDTIVEISKKRYDLSVRKAQANVKALQNALSRAIKDKDIKQKLVQMDASSLQELLRAEAEVEIMESKVQEAQLTLEQANLDLKACQVKAPFTGYLAVRHKEAYESVGPLEKLFTFIDSARVYAVAYVPEYLMRDFEKGKEAAFNHPSGKQFLGKVERIEPMIDPKTDTQKVYVLIDNSEGNLGIGMSGSLEAVK